MFGFLRGTRMWIFLAMIVLSGVLFTVPLTGGERGGFSWGVVVRGLLALFPPLFVLFLLRQLRASLWKVRLGRRLIQPDRPPDEFPPPMLEADDRLSHLGFRGLVILTRDTGFGEMQALLVSPDLRCVATVDAQWLQTGPLCQVYYSSRKDGRRIVTGNPYARPAGPVGRRMAVFFHLGVEDLEGLYQAHLKHCLDLFGEPPEVLVEEEIVPIVRRAHEEMVDRLVAAGLYVPDGPRDRLRLTSSGVSFNLRCALNMPRRGTVVSEIGPNFQESESRTF